MNLFRLISIQWEITDTRLLLYAVYVSIW